MYVMLYGADMPDKLRTATGRARVQVMIEFDVDEFSEKGEGVYSLGGVVRDIDIKKVATSDGQNPIIKKLNDESEGRSIVRTMGTMG
jgi:hypothetical protein